MDAQLGLLGDETPVAELDLGPVQKLLAKRERDLIGLDPLTADEAGAIVHAHRGKHPEDTRCAYCAVDGREALDRLHDRLPLEERSPDLRRPRGRSSSGERRRVEGGAPQPLTEDRPSPGGTAREASSGGGPLSAPDTARPGYAHRGAGDTERAAAQRVAPTSGTARARVLEEIRRAGFYGRTDEELSLALDLRLYTAAPRRKELVDGGWIRDSGRRRPTTTGSPAIVWVLK